MITERDMEGVVCLFVFMKEATPSLKETCLLSFSDMRILAVRMTEDTMDYY